MEFKHYSVLLNECIEGLNIKPDGIYVDGTLGGAGHSFNICQYLGKDGRLIGVDQDLDAIAAASKRLEPYKEHVTIIHSNYENAVPKLKEISIEHVDGILLDLGVSSFQLDNEERGFSYRYDDAPLDMRMDQSSELTAADIINKYSADELARIFFAYGEEKFSKKIAANIVKARVDKAITTAGQLNEIIAASIPAKVRATGGHPSKRVFQAIRIELNRELTVLENSIDDMISILNPGGRFCIITFHSLEDRIVKNAFKRNESPCTCPKDFPVCVCGKKSMGNVVTRKPILPSAKELEENSRSKSAKLRIFERV